MAYHTDIIVDRPAHTREHDIRGHKYIYYVTESKKVEGLRYPRQKRIAVGKPVEGEKGKMYPNDSYFSFFPDEKAKLRTQNKNFFSDTIKVGTVKALQAIAENTGLSELLRAHFGKEYSDFFLDFASCSIINESMVAQHFPNFMRDHAVLSEGKPDDTTVSEYLRYAADNTKIQEFFGDWIRKCGCRGGVCISYDPADINTAAGADTEEFGNANDERTEPVVNVSYVFDPDNGTPLFYEPYIGSINDIAECRRMIEKAKKYDLNEVVFVLDRGYFGKECLKSICRISDGYAVMAKKGIKSVKRVIEEVRDEIESLDHFMVKDGIFGIKTEGCLFPDMRNYFYVYYNPSETETKKYFFQTLAEDRAYLEEKTGSILSEEEIKKYGLWFNMETDGNNRLISFGGNRSAHSEAVKGSGYFVIASNLDKTPGEIYSIYKRRDSIEKIFRNKTYTGFDDLGVQSRSALCTKVFVCFVASILRAHVLKHTEGLRHDGKYYTVTDCIAELEKIEASRSPDGRHAVLYSLTKCQKEILKALDVSVERMDDIRLYE